MKKETALQDFKFTVPPLQESFFTISNQYVPFKVHSNGVRA